MMVQVDPAPLAVGAVEAAKLLGVSPRHLASLTKAGRVPHARLGRRIVYPVKLLSEMLERDAGGAR